MTEDNSTIVVKSGNLVCITYNGSSPLYEKYTKNSASGLFVKLLKNNEGVETNLLNDEVTGYNFNMFNYFAAEVDITSNSILFDEIEKML